MKNKIKVRKNKYLVPLPECSCDPLCLPSSGLVQEVVCVGRNTGIRN